MNPQGQYMELLRAAIRYMVVKTKQANHSEGSVLRMREGRLRPLTRERALVACEDDADSNHWHIHSFRSERSCPIPVVQPEIRNIPGVWRCDPARYVCCPIASSMFQYAVLRCAAFDFRGTY